MDGQCHHNIPFKEALALCVNAGARLCTVAEHIHGRPSSDDANVIEARANKSK